MKKLLKQKLAVIHQRKAQAALISALAVVMAMPAQAATTGSEFKKLADMVQGWTEGYLGMALALAALAIGLSVGLVKQTVMPAIVGLGVALFATMGPGIIMSMFTAVI